jgi:transcriptional regulator with GAF, ATPase, and Fis domain
MARHIEAALARTRGRIEGPAGAAELLGINPHTLRARMRKLRVDWRSFRGA